MFPDNTVGLKIIANVSKQEFLDVDTSPCFRSLSTTFFHKHFSTKTLETAALPFFRKRKHKVSVTKTVSSRLAATI